MMAAGAQAMRQGGAGDALRSDPAGGPGAMAAQDRVASYVHRRVRELLADLDALVFVSRHPGAIWGTAQRGIDEAQSERVTADWWHPATAEHAEALAQRIAASLRAAWDAVPKPDAEGRLRVQAWRQADGRVVWEPRPTAKPITIVLEPGSRLAQHAMGADRLVCRAGEMRGLRVMEAVEVGWARVEDSTFRPPPELLSQSRAGKHAGVGCGSRKT
jgi:hypothetical protein